MNVKQNPLEELEKTTERSKEKEQEDRKFVSVIIKRNDEARRHPDDILDHAIEEGLIQFKRPALSLILSSIAAGLILGFSVMAVAVMHTVIGQMESPWMLRLGQALVYPLGFVVCIMAGTELFTEHTATAVYPVLDRKASVAGLLRLWGIVLAGNLFGAAVSAFFLASADSVIQARDAYIEIGSHLTEYAFGSLLISALLAGWLMALGGWLILATSPNLTQIVSIYIVTFLIGIGGLHHSIAGSVELFTAVFLDGGIPATEGITFLVVAILGNLIGGSLFVAVLNYGHIRKSQEIPA